MGKWAARATVALSDIAFWILVLVSHKLSTTLDILLWTMQKYSSQNKVGDDDSSEYDREIGSCARLVFGKDRSIYDGACSLHNLSEWEHILDFARRKLLEGLGGKINGELLQGIRK